MCSAWLQRRMSKSFTMRVESRKYYCETFCKMNVPTNTLQLSYLRVKFKNISYNCNMLACIIKCYQLSIIATGG